MTPRSYPTTFVKGSPPRSGSNYVKTRGVLMPHKWGCGGQEVPDVLMPHKWGCGGQEVPKGGF